MGGNSIMSNAIPQKINDLPLQAELLDTHQFEIDDAGAISGKINGLQFRQALASFPIVNAVKVEIGGDDSNDGSIQRPFETYQAAHDSLTGSDLSMIYSDGIGEVDQTLNITRDNVIVFAPKIKLNPSSGDAITVNSPSAESITVNFNSISPQSGKSVNIVAANESIFSTVMFNGEFSSTSGVHKVNTITMMGDINSGGILYIDALIYPVSGVVSGNVYGRLGRTWLGEMQFIDRLRFNVRDSLNIGSSRFVQDTDIGRRLFTSNQSSPITLTLPEQSTLSMQEKSQFEVLVNEAGGINFVAESPGIIKGTTGLNNEGDHVTITLLLDSPIGREWLISR